MNANLPLVALIDDDEASVLALSLVLGDWGFDVISGGDADTVLSALVARNGARLHAVVTDYHLAKGDGVAAGLAIRRWLGQPCPVIVISGSRGGSPARAASRHGFPLLLKPFEPERLHVLLDRLPMKPS